MNAKVLLFFSILLFSFQLDAQLLPCGTPQMVKVMEQYEPDYQDAVNRAFETARQQYKNGFVSTRSDQKVQVVFHVVYNTPQQNIPDQVIFDQLARLNEDFNYNPANDFVTRPIYKDLGDNANIEFVLAQFDPNGNPTTGINRIQTDVPSFMQIDFGTLLQAIFDCGIDITADTLSQEQLDCLTDALGGSGLTAGLDDIKSFDKGGVDAWDPTRYINIWIGNYGIELVPGESEPFLLGFAYPPADAPNWPAGTLPPNLEEVEGVVLHYQAVGPNNPTAGSLIGSNDQGRTLSHEMGHYFGLRHAWGDGPCDEDDGIDDTPPMASSISDQLGQNFDPTTFTCDDLGLLNSCTSDQLPDMYENYMNYTPESCQSIFTKEQVGLMNAMLQGPRAGLLDIFLNNTEVDDLQLSFYPNPSNGAVEIHSNFPGDVITQVFDLNGKMVHSSTERTLDLSALATGLYVLKINQNGRVVFEKLTLHQE
ncbi:MAG: zinc-dependent metalloprotease [Saprospiraceae bacterium]|nr:zinc-dependent metalloprotease [Saprospiraceae bacterium]